MPKPLLHQWMQTNSKDKNLLNISVAQKSTEKTQIDKLKTDRLLRKQRSKTYMDALCKLDAGGHVHNAKQGEEIHNAIHNESPEVNLSGILIGYVAICYLGKPYEVHTLDFTGNIIEHYKPGKLLPNDMEKARSIALYGGCAVVSGGAKGIDTAAALASIRNGNCCIEYLSDSLTKKIKNKDTICAIRNKQLLILSVAKPDAGFNTGIAMMRNKYIYANRRESLL